MTLGGWLVGGIVWHISVMWIVFVDGVAYLLYGFSTGISDGTSDQPDHAR